MKIPFEIETLHTTELGYQRIKKGLGIEDDVLPWCKKKILDSNHLVKKGKNWYVEVNDLIITINASSNTIITAHKKKK